MMSQGYVLWRTRLGVAVSLVLRRFAVWVAVAVLDHRVVIQPFTHHLLLLGTYRGRERSIRQHRAQLISFRNMEVGRRVERCV